MPLSLLPWLGDTGGEVCKGRLPSAQSERRGAISLRKRFSSQQTHLFLVPSKMCLSLKKRSKHSNSE